MFILYCNNTNLIVMRYYWWYLSTHKFHTIFWQIICCPCPRIQCCVFTFCTIKVPFPRCRGFLWFAKNYKVLCEAAITNFLLIFPLYIYIFIHQFTTILLIKKNHIFQGYLLFHYADLEFFLKINCLRLYKIGQTPKKIFYFKS